MRETTTKARDVLREDDKSGRINKRRAEKALSGTRASINACPSCSSAARVSLSAPTAPGGARFHGDLSNFNQVWHRNFPSPTASSSHMGAGHLGEGDYTVE